MVWLCVVPFTKLHQTLKIEQMESNIEIFDKDGKALHIGSVVGRFLFEQSKIHKPKDEEYGMTIGISGRKSKPTLCVFDNDYNILDKLYLNDL